MAGTITLLTPDPTYQEHVTFQIDITGRDTHYDCSGKEGCWLVYVEAFQDGNLVYGELGTLSQARRDGTDPAEDSIFILGGGSSQWVTNGGGPAHCRASVFRYGKEKGKQVKIDLDGAITEFEANG